MMKCKNIVPLLLLMASCSSPSSKLYEFDPRSLKENKFTLSEIADEVTYIPLENSIPLGAIFNIKPVNNMIYFSSKGIGLLVFDRGRKILRKIGTVGRGPEEYLSGGNFTVDENTGTVYILDMGDIIKVFSSTGQFIKSFKLQEFGASGAIEFYKSKLFISYSIQFENTKYQWIVFDTLGNVIKKEERKMPMFIGNYGNNNTTYKFEHRIFYWNNYADTVFSVLPDLRKEPSFIISPGEFRIPRSRLTFEQHMQNKFLHLFMILETNHFFVIEYFYKRTTLALIDKLDNGKESFLIYLGNENDDYLNGIENDIDAGLSFIPVNYFVENGREYMIGVQYPDQIKTKVVSAGFVNSTPEYPEKKKELEKLANSLKETDNPVLMIVRLKK